MITSEFPPITPYAQSSVVHSYLHPKEIDAFNFPLCEEFMRGPLFVCVTTGVINIDRMMETYGDQLQRAAQFDRRAGRGQWKTTHAQLLFKLAPDCWAFITSRAGGCRVFARDRATAERMSREIVTRFRGRTARKPKPCFFLLNLTRTGNMATIAVDLPLQPQRSSDDLALLYGDDFPVWEEGLTESLAAQTSGTVILRGPPGTGKTSFIRHLIGRLHGSHRFYYLPVTSFELLTEPRLVEFWSEEARFFPDHRKVVVLEDAEALLAERDIGRRGNIANLLNIADGLLGDFLKIQLVCTVNCDLDRLDPAIVRGGRLVAWREFPRISPERAQRIAARHELQLAHQDDYSLADIFRGKALARAARSRRLLGFAASAPCAPDDTELREEIAGNTVPF